MTAARLAADESRWRLHLGPRFGADPLPKITSRRIGTWLAAMEAAGVGESTRYQVLMLLRQVLDLAVEQGALKVNPAKGLKVAEGDPTGIKPQGETDVLTPDEVDRLVQAVDVRYRALILLASRLGATWAVALGLRRSDIDFKNSTVTLGAVEGIEARGKVEDRPGPPESVRTVMMPPDVSAALRDHLARRTDDDEHVFLSPQGKRPLRPNFHVWVLRPALVDAGLRERSVTFHTLRHGAAAHMLAAGVPVEEVSRVLGHRSVITTKKLYGAFIQERNVATPSTTV